MPEGKDGRRYLMRMSTAGQIFYESLDGPGLGPVYSSFPSQGDVSVRPTPAEQTQSDAAKLKEVRTRIRNFKKPPVNP